MLLGEFVFVPRNVVYLFFSFFCFRLFLPVFVFRWGGSEGKVPRAGPIASRGTQARGSGTLASECLPSARVEECCV